MDQIPDILQRIVDRRREDVARSKSARPLARLQEQIAQMPHPRDFHAAISRTKSGEWRVASGETTDCAVLSLDTRHSSLSLIAEIKRRSPSKGLIRPDFDHKQIARIYEASPAAAISVLTEPNFFDGALTHLAEVREITSKPVLRKDFLFDEYQVYEARAAGADAVLLIVAMLDDAQLRDLHALAVSLGMAVLVEVHDEEEASRALAAGARIVGINNRNLRDFSEDLETTIRLLPLIPDGVVIVSESAIRSRDDVRLLEDTPVDAILVGESLMRSGDIGEGIRKLLFDETTSLEPFMSPSNGHFGPYGGQFVPETLMYPVQQLAEVYEAAKQDPEFHREFDYLLKQYVGRPTPLYFAARLTEHFGGPRIYLKREDLLHTGAHKINNTVGQALLTRRMGKPRVIAETGAGQHGVATATVAALFGFECVVYMGTEDMRRQALNVFRMQLLGAEVVSVDSGSRTLKDAINEAMRDWVTNVHNTHYLLGSVLGPHPYPTMVRDFQSVIGREARAQVLEIEGKLPDALVACVGGGSNSIGLFHPFIEDETVQMHGVEAGGRGSHLGEHAARFMRESGNRHGVLHGCHTYVLQNEEGQIAPTHSVSAGLDYPSIGPEHAYLHDSGRVQYASVTDGEALEAFQLLGRLEGILPALESAHAIAYLKHLAPMMRADQIVIVNLSGRGDKDVVHAQEEIGKERSHIPSVTRTASSI